MVAVFCLVNLRALSVWVFLLVLVFTVLMSWVAAWADAKVTNLLVLPGLITILPALKESCLH